MFHIIFNEDTVEISENGSITGELYFQLEDRFFPFENWNDFIVVILSWWNKSANLLANASVGTTVNFVYMDGPYVVRGKKSDDGNLIQLSFLERTSNGEVLIEITDVEIQTLRNSIRKISNEVLKNQLICNRQNNDDIIELKKVMSL
ncbi:MAG: hypothetical protein NAG76_16920 [Candidatus Pristimantibacillus lignocellulolyticus]|uniref:Uncharacterized protein n=1 Tax=Candidatus Pristimantibacillus lignocellulolyticus TaxID=2994561 RepID=A0A9J6ZBI1_9BACL|nr:MAG: hypothetical protein NAG76_16920 [Candidatus Pristimantibacillus lignocellulolyticus]